VLGSFSSRASRVPPGMSSVTAIWAGYRLLVRSVYRMRGDLAPIDSSRRVAASKISMPDEWANGLVGSSAYSGRWPSQ
jgi:hypothetical protein